MAVNVTIGTSHQNKRADRQIKLILCHLRVE
jgi:hypothetical protein